MYSCKYGVMWSDCDTCDSLRWPTGCRSLGPLTVKCTNMKIHEKSMQKSIKINEKSMKTHENPWKIHENPWKSMKNQWKSMNNPWKSMKIHEHLWKINENPWTIQENPWKSMNIHEKSMKIHEKSMFSEPWVPVTNLKGNFLLSQDPVLHVLRSAISLCGCRAGLPLSHFGCRIWTKRNFVQCIAANMGLCDLIVTPVTLSGDQRVADPWVLWP